MKINVGAAYKIDSELLVSFFNHIEEDHSNDTLIYMGKFFLYSISTITGEKAYDMAYIFYSEENKTFLYTIKRENFALDEEFDVNLKFVNFKDNKIFINNKSFKNFLKSDKDKKLHTVWIDEDDYLSNKEETDILYNNHHK